MAEPSLEPIVLSSRPSFSERRVWLDAVARANKPIPGRGPRRRPARRPFQRTRSRGPPPGAGTPKPGYPASSTRTELIFGSGDDDQVYVNDVDQRTTRAMTLPQWYSPSQYRKWQSIPLYGPVVPVGNRLVYFVGPKQEPAKGVVLSVATALNEPPLRLIGNKVEYHDGVGPYFAATGAARIWVSRREGGSTYRATELNADTDATVAVSPPLGHGAYPVAAMSDGLLTQTVRRHHAVLELRSVAPDHATTVITRQANAQAPLIAAGDETVAWEGDSTCAECGPIRLTNTATGKTVAVTLTPGLTPQCLVGSLSPNERWLAVIYGCDPPSYRRAVVVIRTKTGAARVVPASHGAQVGDGIFWSPNNRWLFWEGGGNSESATVFAYRMGTRAPSRFAVHSHGRALAGAFPSN